MDDERTLAEYMDSLQGHLNDDDEIRRLQSVLNAVVRRCDGREGMLWAFALNALDAALDASTSVYDDAGRLNVLKQYADAALAQGQAAIGHANQALNEIPDENVLVFAADMPRVGQAAATALAVLRPDAPTVGRNDVAANRQSHPHPVGFGGNKRLKNTFQLPFRNSGAPVAHDDLHLVMPKSPCAHLHPAPLGRRLAG